MSRRSARKDRIIDIIRTYVRSPDEIARIIDRAGLDPPTMLIYAAYFGHLDVVKYLIENRLVRSQRNTGSALRTAVAGRHLDIVEYLVGEAKVSLRTHGEVALAWAFELNDYPEIAHYLIMKGVRLGDNRIQTWAAKHGFLDIIRLLEKEGADILDPAILSAAAEPYLYFREDEHLDVIMYLIYRGANMSELTPGEISVITDNGTVYGDLHSKPAKIKKTFEEYFGKNLASLILEYA